MDNPYEHDIVRLLKCDVPLMRSSTSAETEPPECQHHDEHELNEDISQ